MTGKGGRNVIKGINCAISILERKRFTQGDTINIKKGPSLSTVQPLGQEL